MATDKYLAIGHYRTLYPHQVIFVNTNTITTERQNMFNELIVLAQDPMMPFIQTKKETSVAKQEIITYWCRACDNYYDESNSDLIYHYVNDLDQFLSPKNLRTKILSITEHNGLKLNIDQCTMITDELLDIDYQPPIMLRFYSKAELTIAEIKNLFKGYDMFKKILPSSNDGINFCGFGYVQVDNIETARSLVNKVAVINEIRIMFDLG